MAMATPVKMPELGESITEGTITRWLKQEGDRVEVDEPLFEVSTDKVDTEVPSPVAGVLQSIKVQVDETVEVGAELAVIEQDGEGGGAAQPAPAEAQAEEAEAAEAPAAPRRPRRPGPSRPGRPRPRKAPPRRRSRPRRPSGARPSRPPAPGRATARRRWCRRWCDGSPASTTST